MWPCNEKVLYTDQLSIETNMKIDMQFNYIVLVVLNFQNSEYQPLYEFLFNFVNCRLKNVYILLKQVNKNSIFFETLKTWN